MAAGDHVHCVGVLRIVVGPVFSREVVVEVHKGIEDREGDLYYQQLETHSLDWKSFKKLAGKEDFEAVLRVLNKCGAVCSKEMKSLKKSKCQPFDDGHERHVSVTDVL